MHNKLYNALILVKRLINRIKLLNQWNKNLGEKKVEQEVMHLKQGSEQELMGTDKVRTEKCLNLSSSNQKLFLNKKKSLRDNMMTLLYSFKKQLIDMINWLSALEQQFGSMREQLKDSRNQINDVRRQFKEQIQPQQQTLRRQLKECIDSSKLQENTSNQICLRKDNFQNFKEQMKRQFSHSKQYASQQINNNENRLRKNLQKQLQKFIKKSVSDQILRFHQSGKDLVAKKEIEFEREREIDNNEQLEKGDKRGQEGMKTT